MNIRKFKHCEEGLFFAVLTRTTIAAKEIYEQNFH
jgi:hypothetical protein